jgi:hypothetical protein
MLAKKISQHIISFISSFMFYVTFGGFFAFICNSLAESSFRYFRESLAKVVRKTIAIFKSYPALAPNYQHT